MFYGKNAGDVLRSVSDSTWTQVALLLKMVLLTMLRNSLCVEKHQCYAVKLSLILS